MIKDREDLLIAASCLALIVLAFVIRGHGH
jgi:hypothetical protein